jgi:hypothetical protein
MYSNCICFAYQGCNIGENRLGGGYSYRASEAALNMLVKTAAIEAARTHPQAVLVALHPGTVNSALSAPFNGAEIGRPAADAAGDMLRVLDGLGRRKRAVSIPTAGKSCRGEGGVVCYCLILSTPTHQAPVDDLAYTGGRWLRQINGLQGLVPALGIAT